MRMNVRWRVARLAALVLGLGFLIAISRANTADFQTTVYKPVLPDDEFARLVTEDAQIVKDGLAQAADEKMAIKAKAAALMIAVYAQGEMQKPGANVPAMAGLRDSALKVVKAIEDGNVEEAKKLADDLTPAGKPDPAAKPTPLPLHESIAIDEVMHQFKPERSGGLGMETKLLTLAKKRSFTPDEYRQMVPMLYRIAAIAQPSAALPPEPLGKKTPDRWVQFAQDMGTLAQQAAELAKQPRPDAAAVSEALKRLDDNCINCHTVFRDG